MQLIRIANLRIDSQGNGAEQVYKLAPRGGGRMLKTVQYSVKMLQTSGGSDIRISVELRQSPDGTVDAPHSVPINLGNPGPNPPALLVGDADQNKIVGEYLHPVLKIQHAAGSSGSAVWAMVELFEMRKPF